MANRAVAQARLADAEAIEKSLRAEITSNLEAQNLSMARVGGFTISIRRTKVWVYSSLNHSFSGCPALGIKQTLLLKKIHVS